MQSLSSAESSLATSTQTPQEEACSSSANGEASSSQTQQEEAQESAGRDALAAAEGEPLETMDRTSRFGSDRLSGRRSSAQPTTESAAVATESDAAAPESSVSTPRSPRTCGVRSPRLASLRFSARRESQGSRPKALSVTVARRSISGSLVGRGGPDDSPCSPAGSEDSLSHAQSAQTKPVRLMRLRDQIELTKEMVEGTVIYLSPHYRQLPASGVAEDADDITHNMYNELSMQFGALGVKIKSEIEVAFTDDQRALMLTVLCPGFFGNSELVEETARALRSIQRQKNATGGAAERAKSGLSGPRSRQNSGARLEREASGRSSRQSSGILRTELSTSLSGLSRRFSSFKRKPKSMLLLASTAISDDEYFRTCPVDLKELGLFDSHHFEKWPESHWLQTTAVKTVIYKLPGHHHATRYERASDMLMRLGGRGGADVGRPTPELARLSAVPERRERRTSAADMGARRLSSGDCAALSPRSRGRRASRGSSSSVSMDEEMDQAARTRQWLSEEDSEERYQRERAAYRAMRKKGADGPASPATLPRMPSLSKKALKGSLPPPPAALPPEELAPSSSTDAPRARSFPAALEPPKPVASEPMLDEHGSVIPLARRDSGRHVLPRAPPDALEGACVSQNARTTPPLPSSSLLPGLSIAAAVHEPQRPVAPERMPSLSKKASKRALPEPPSSMPPGAPRCSSRESERRSEETPSADEPHVMSSPRPECQRRLSGFL